MKNFIPNLDERYSSEGIIELLKKLPENTINILEGNLNVPSIAELHEGTVCLGYISGLNRAEIITTIPEEAAQVRNIDGGVAFRLEGQEYSVRCGHTYSKGYVQRID